MKHIAVLMGGWSAEREVSLNSGKACAKALDALGYKVTAIDVKPNIAEVLAELKPDAVFNALHGRWGEDGCVQGILECLKIPYTHSGVLASALAMDKPMAKKVLIAEGIRMPEGKVVTKADMQKGDPMARPYVLKPINEGSSVGVHIIHAGDNLPLEEIFAEHAEMLAETYVPGRELAVAVLGDKVLGAVELKPSTEFYDYKAKYTGGVTEHLMPAPIHEAAYKEACAIALKAHQSLGCRGLSRSDLRYDDTKGEPGLVYLLEVNTQPGMTELSLSPEIAAHAGISFNNLVKSLVESATLDSCESKGDGETDKQKTHCARA